MIISNLKWSWARSHRFEFHFCRHSFAIVLVLLVLTDSQQLTHFLSHRKVRAIPAFARNMVCRARPATRRGPS